MNDAKKPTIVSEDIVDVEEVVTPKKRSHLKFHISAILLLGVGTWVFWTYSPVAAQWQKQWVNNTVIQALMQQAPAPVTPAKEPTTETSNTEGYDFEEAVEDDTFEETMEVSTNETPLFEPAPNLTPNESYKEESQPETLAALSAIIQQLQGQVSSLQQNMNQMYAQQFKQSQQQVRAQIFTALQAATSQLNTLEASSSAWKSISLLPMVDAQHKVSAEQAFADLNDLNRDAQTLANEISAMMITLATQLQPDELAEVTETLDNLVDEYANTDTLMTWLDWLKQQFRVSKVDQHALVISDDPYADIKALIAELHQLKTTLQSGHWQDIGDLEALIHQLEQHGIQTSLSTDMIENMKETQQFWQQQAQAWMEQL